GLKIGQVQIRHPAAKKRERLVHDRVAMHQCAAVRSRKIAGSEYGIGSLLSEGHQQRGNISRVVLEISVMHNADITRGIIDSSSDSRPFSTIPLVPQQHNAIVVRSELLQQLP